MSKKQRPITNLEAGKMFLHCGLCLKEKPADESPRSWARFSVGWTDIGLQIWCTRHEVNVCHIDFEGKQHPANSTMVLPEDTSGDSQSIAE